jgi:hypothetical protein
MLNDMRNAAELRKIVTEKEREIALLQQRVDWLTQQFKLMQARKFDVSSERTTALAGQISLFNEAETSADSKAPEPELERVAYTRKKPKGKREADFS